MARYRRFRGGDRFGMFTAAQAADSSTAGLTRMHFAGVNAYLSYVDQAYERARERQFFTGSHLWSGRSRNGTYEGDDWSAPSGLHALRTGDLARGKRFAEMADEFEESIYVERREWRSNVAGGFVNVGAFLAGRPDCMWERSPELSDRDPVRVWIGVTASAGVSAEQIEKRGAALCAFAIALSQTRPVLLTPYVLLGGAPGVGALLSYDLEAPMVLSEVAAALATPSVTRALGLAACYFANPACTGAWWRDYDNPERMREQLGCADQDVYLGSIHMSDPLIVDPTAWIKANLTTLTRGADYESEGE